MFDKVVSDYLSRISMEVEKRQLFPKTGSHFHLLILKLLITILPST